MSGKGEGVYTSIHIYIYINIHIPINRYPIPCIQYGETHMGFNPPIPVTPPHAEAGGHGVEGGMVRGCNYIMDIGHWSSP